MWRPGSGNPNRSFLLASERVWNYYHRELKRIKVENFSAPPSEDEYAIDVEHRFEYDVKLREIAIQELRDYVVSAHRYGSVYIDGKPESSRGPFLIPV